MTTKRDIDAATPVDASPADRAIDEAVGRYRELLAGEVDIGRAALDEIEDHMRSLVADLRATGMPTANAITEAAERLGDPREVAREHARVRTSFGAKLPCGAHSR